MTTDRYEHDAAPALHPFPEGWYFVAGRAALERQTLIGKTWLGARIVAWSDRAGAVCVARAVCPHLGADLGPEAGGRVRDGRLVCPFHGYEYDAAGRCVATPYAPPPEAARLTRYETREFEGLVFAWHGIGGRAPQWELPAPEGGAQDWSDPEFWSVRFRGHPQETTENSVDLAHLRHVHGYDAVSGVGPVEVAGARLTSRFDFKRTQKIAGVRVFAWDVSAVTYVHGLGYSLVEVREHSIGMDTRLWVLATPVDGERGRAHAGKPDPADGAAPASRRRHALPSARAAHPADEPDRHRRPGEGRDAGRRHLGPQTLPPAPVPLPVGRRDRDLPALLRAVLSGRPGLPPRRRRARAGRMR